MFTDPKILEIIQSDSELLVKFKDMLAAQMSVDIETRKAQLQEIQRSIIDSLPKVKAEEKDEFAKQTSPYRDQF